MKILSWMICGLFALAPAGARARECHTAAECVANLAMGQLDTRMATVTGVAAAAVIAAGAVATAARSVDKAAPEGVMTTADATQKPKSTLELLPSRASADPAPSATPAERKRSADALRLNEAITNVGLAVTGVAVLGAIVGGIAGNAKKR
jgi:hypothetical protein